MPDFGTFHFDMTPIYVDLGDSLGAYVIDPGETPFIVLHTSLKDKQDPTAQLVYQALLAFHHELPTAYQLFPLTQFYEDLPATHQPATIPEIIIFARPARRWGYSAYLPDDYRLIGRLG